MAKSAPFFIGIDEVGRGCWAGPMLVVAAQARTDLPIGLKDSKLLSKKQREALFEKLQDTCDYGQGWVSPPEIDKIGLAGGLRLAGRRALDALNAELGAKIILDGSYNYLPGKYINVKYFPKADNLEPIVSAASIIAKVLRDNFMNDLSLEHPAYSFDKHVGYGTKLHNDALSKLGPIKGVHRFSYKPIIALKTA